MYHIATLVGRVPLRQPVADWPALTARPWTATSAVDFWSFSWYQFFRHTFVAFGTSPCGALLGAFGVSAWTTLAGGVSGGVRNSAAPARSSFSWASARC